MPITFKKNHDGGYLEIQYKGQVSDSEVLSAYESYFGSDDVRPVSNDLTDISEADLSNLTTDAIRELADYIINLYKKTGISSLKTAIYAPDSLQFGLSRMYDAISYDTSQDIKIFKDREKAIQWLRTSQ